MPTPIGKAGPEDWKRLSLEQFETLIEKSASEFWPLIYHYVDKKVETRLEQISFRLQYQEETMEHLRASTAGLRSVNSRLKNELRDLDDRYNKQLKKDRARIRRELCKKFTKEFVEIDFERMLLQLEREGFKRKLAEIYDREKT